MCRDTCTRKSAIKCLPKLNTIWQTVLQKYRKTPRVFIVRDFLIICTLSPLSSSLHSLTKAPASSLASCTAQWRSEYRPVLLAPLSGLMMLFEASQSASQPVVDIGPHLTDYLSGIMEFTCQHWSRARAAADIQHQPFCCQPTCQRWLTAKVARSSAASSCQLQLSAEVYLAGICLVYAHTFFCFSFVPVCECSVLFPHFTFDLILFFFY